MTKTIEDEERAYYIRNGVNQYGNEVTPCLRTMDDMRKVFYLNNITLPATPTVKEKNLTVIDLEVIWLKEQSGLTSSSNANDLWSKWLKGTYGDLSVDDLKIQYYIDN